MIQAMLLFFYRADGGIFICKGQHIRTEQPNKRYCLALTDKQVWKMGREQQVISI